MPWPFFLHLHTLKEDFPFSELTLKSAYRPCTNNFLSIILWQVIQPIHYSSAVGFYCSALAASISLPIISTTLRPAARQAEVAQLVSLVFIKMSHCVCAHKLVIPHFEESTCNQVNARQMSNQKMFDFTESSELTMVKSNGCQRLSKIKVTLQYSNLALENLPCERFSSWICKKYPPSAPCPINCAFTFYFRLIGLYVVNVQRVSFRFNFQGKATFCGFGIQHRSRDVAIGSNFHSGWLSETALPSQWASPWPKGQPKPQQKQSFTTKVCQSLMTFLRHMLAIHLKAQAPHLRVRQ